MLLEQFAEAKGTKTWRGAYDRVAKFEKNHGTQDIRYAIQSRIDGTFMPIVFLADDQTQYIRAAVDCGLGVMKF